MDRIITEQIPADQLSEHVEKRLHLILERDLKIRHGGVLRDAAKLVLHRRYARHEIINHFGVQYDPASHATGVIEFPGRTVIITKLDTTGAKREFQYENAFLSDRIMQWQSQNRQRRDNRPGRRLLDYRQLAIELHLFVQRRATSEAVYLGCVDIRSVRGDGPMTLELSLRDPLSSGVAGDLGIAIDRVR